MTKLTEFKLEIDTRRKVFAPGDQIPCIVILTLDDQLETKGIEIVFEGKWVCVFFSLQGIFAFLILMFFLDSAFFTLKDKTFLDF